MNRKAFLTTLAAIPCLGFLKQKPDFDYDSKIKRIKEIQIEDMTMLNMKNVKKIVENETLKTIQNEQRPGGLLGRRY